MGSVNKVILVGNLGRDAELRYTPGGAAVANFSLATTETWTDKNSGQRQEHTEWHRVDVWGKRAEALQQYLRKGLRIYVEGSLRTRQWEDRDGNKRSSTDIRADRIEFLDSRGEGGGRRAEGGGDGRSQAQAPASSEQGAPGGGPDLTEDDIPF